MRCDSEALEIAFNRILGILAAGKEEILRGLDDPVELSRTPAVDAFEKLKTRNPSSDERPTDDRIVMFWEGVKWAIGDVKNHENYGFWPKETMLALVDTLERGTL